MTGAACGAFFISDVSTRSAKYLLVRRRRLYSVELRPSANLINSRSFIARNSASWELGCALDRAVPGCSDLAKILRVFHRGRRRDCRGTREDFLGRRDG